MPAVNVSSSNFPESVYIYAERYYMLRNWKELEDQEWFPDFLRRMQTDYIGFMVRMLGVYRQLNSMMESAFERMGHRSILDLCSGNGEAVLSLAERCRPDSVILTDKFPASTFPANRRYVYDVVSRDALRDDFPGRYVRTMFNAWHHFTLQEQQTLLQKHGPDGLLVAEILEPDALTFLRVGLASSVLQVVLCPFVKPFRPLRLLFTWIIPVNIFTVLYDGWVSVARSKRFSLLVQEVKENLPEGCKVESGSYFHRWTKVNWFLVLPDDK